jgi:tetratricopeptide (TPR) repeat protein
VVAQRPATLGLVLRELGRPEARDEFERAAELWSLHYGPQHPTLGRVRFELALVEEREGRHLQAVTNYEAASRVFEQVFGADSVVVGRAAAALGRNLGELGRHEEAVRQYQRAREIFAAHGDATAIELAAALDGEGIVQRRRGQPELAIPLHEKALTLLARGGRGVDAFDRADVHVHLGEALLELGRTSEAREQFELAVALLKPISAGQASARRAVIRRMAAGAWASGDEQNVERARELAGLARSEFVTLKATDSIAELDAFLGTLAAQG